MNTFTQIMYDEIQRAENMLANYVGISHGTVQLDDFRPESFDYVSNDVKSIIKSLQVLPVPANPSQNLTARYMNLVDALGTAVSKPRIHPAMLLAHNIEDFLSGNVLTAVARHAMMAFLTFGAGQMPSAIAQIIAFVAMLSAGLASSRFTKKTPGIAMAIGYVACMVAYTVGALLAKDNQAVTGALAGVWLVTSIISIASVVLAFINDKGGDDIDTAVLSHNEVLGSYHDPINDEYSAIDVGGSTRFI